MKNGQPSDAGERVTDLPMARLVAIALGPWGDAEIEDPMQVLLDEIRERCGTVTALVSSDVAREPLQPEVETLMRRVQLAAELYERVREEQLVERYGYKAYDLIAILSRALSQRRGEPPRAAAAAQLAACAAVKGCLSATPAAPAAIDLLEAIKRSLVGAAANTSGLDDGPKLHRNSIRAPREAPSGGAVGRRRPRPNKPGTPEKDSRPDGG